jgi:GrpB-like predicted nucleotidyltransferase (UPF0157 family)
VPDADPNPADLWPHDPRWADRAQTVLTEIRDVLRDLEGAEQAAFDHIGSTSVPGLMAKPYLDLQVRMLPLPTHDELTARLAPLGLERAQGSRPDSPGVTRDVPRGHEIVVPEVWEKRLYVGLAGSVILHVRRSDSPWGLHTVWFRDWLRATPGARADYEATKLELSAQNVAKPDFDDYTRAKTAFFDRVQVEFTSWAAAR